jgi:hypothetical protein
MALSSPSVGQIAPGSSGATRLRAVAVLYVVCVVALAAGGALLGLRLVQAGGSAEAHTHGAGPSGLGVPGPTSFGTLEVESVAQIRGLTPKALAGMSHGIQSLVKADHMQVQLVLALRNVRAQTIGYDPADFRLRLVKGSRSRVFDSATTSVRAAALLPRSTMESTLGFVIPRFNPRGTRLSLEFSEPGRPPLNLDLGPVRPGGSAASVRAALAHHH